MTYNDFVKFVSVSHRDMCQQTYAERRSTLRIKKRETVVRNLEKIFDAVLKISNQKGFRAMTMRALSRECGLSMGALYTYFSSKDELLEMLQDRRRKITTRILEERVALETTPRDKLRAAIFTHLYLSEIMQPWFYFSFMETKNLSKPERGKAVAGELENEHFFEEIIRQGQQSGVFADRNSRLTASQIKALLQDWYLKRSKYGRRNVDVEEYARATVEMVESTLMCPAPGGRF